LSRKQQIKGTYVAVNLSNLEGFSGTCEIEEEGQEEGFQREKKANQEGGPAAPTATK